MQVILVVFVDFDRNCLQGLAGAGVLLSCPKDFPTFSDLVGKHSTRRCLLHNELSCHTDLKMTEEIKAI